jgi:hypothetical protein
MGMKSQGKTKRDQFMSVWCILKVCYTLELKWYDLFKVIETIKTPTISKIKKEKISLTLST